MIGIILASHGPLCNGIKESAEMIAGPLNNCETIPLLQGDTPEEYSEKLEKAIERLDQGQGVIVVVDIRGGTPFNQALFLSKSKNITILMGLNLPMLLALTLSRNDDSEMEALCFTAKNEAIESIGIINYKSYLKQL